MVFDPAQGLTYPGEESRLFATGSSFKLFMSCLTLAWRIIIVRIGMAGCDAVGEVRSSWFPPVPLARTNVKYYYIFVQSAERWNSLYELASSQGGYFTARQVADCGFSPQLLEHHVGTGRLQRIQRGIYRLTHFPRGEHDDLIILWLWSEQQGVFSHGTALALHELSDYLPVRYHITVPSQWKNRRLRTPDSVHFHYTDLPHSDCVPYGCFFITTVAKTLADCKQGQMSPEWLAQAQEQAEQRGLILSSKQVGQE